MAKPSCLVQVVSPHGLTFDSDTESRDCWSFSMATPKQAAGTTEMGSSVETAVSSTSADESYSGNGTSLGGGKGPLLFAWISIIL